MTMWLQIVLRTITAVLFLLLLTKVLGKRQVTELSVFEYITGITIGNLAGYVSLEADKQWYLGLVALTSWAALSMGIELLQMKSKKARDWIDGQPTVLIQKGKILEGNMKKERVTTDELMESLRTRDIFKVADVEFAVMEVSGAINVMPKAEVMPLTPKTLGLRVQPEHEPQVVVMDGKILPDPLRSSGYNEQWLKKEFMKSNARIEDVFFAQIDDSGSLYYDLFDDKVKPPKTPNGQASLLAALKKCEADMELYALQSADEKERLHYAACSKRLQQLIDDVRPLIYQ